MGNEIRPDYSTYKTIKAQESYSILNKLYNKQVKDTNKGTISFQRKHIHTALCQTKDI